MPASPFKLFKALPATVRLLIYGTFINRMGGFILPFLTLVLRHEFKLAEDDISTLLLLYGIGSLSAILTGGWLIDRFGRRSTLVFSLGGGGILAVTMGFAHSIQLLAPLLLTYGFVGELYRPAAAAIIGDQLPSQQRAIGFAALRLAVNLGFAFGTSLGGFLIDWNWRILFWADGATTLLFGLIVLARIPETRPSTVGQPAITGPPIWRDGIYLQLLLVSFVTTLVFFSHLCVLPLTITDSAHYPAWVYGLLIAFNCLLIALCEMSAVDALQRFRRLRVAALGTLFTGAGFALTGVMLHWSWLTLTVVIWSAGEIFSSAQLMAFISDWAPPAVRGRYLSYFQATWSLAFALTPMLFLPLHARLPEILFWPLMLLPTLPAALLLLRLDRIADRPELLRGATKIA
jgi:MFS family permease